MKKKIPNILSIVRIALVPVFLVLFFLPFYGMRFAALGVFLVASLTDFLDGYLARKWKAQSDVGNFLDTIADKMLVCAAVIAVVVSLAMGVGDYGGDGFISSTLFLVIVLVATISAIIIVLRELFIAGFKMMASTKGVKIKADIIGKIKMIVQVVALAVLIPFYDITAFSATVGDVFLAVGTILLLEAALMSIASCVFYMVKYRGIFGSGQLEDSESTVVATQSGAKGEQSSEEEKNNEQ